MAAVNETSTTTAASNNTTGLSERAVIPDAPTEKTAIEPAPAATTATAGVTAPVEAPDKLEKKTHTPIQDLWISAKSHGHGEIWGVELADPDTHIPSQIIFQKYLNANDGDLDKAKDQLIKTLEWRKEVKPLELLDKSFSKDKFGGLGCVTTYGDARAADPEEKAVFTWNIYGLVKDMNNTFGDLRDFLAWRVALMELAVASLNLPAATTAITVSYDPYKIYQVHDYKSISFFSQPASVKTASKETIKVFAQNYPELLKEKFFINVPAVMGFMYGLMKLFVAAKTVKKFHPMSNGGALAKEFGESKVKGLADMLPPEYGGHGDDLGLGERHKFIRTE